MCQEGTRMQKEAEADGEEIPYLTGWISRDMSGLSWSVRELDNANSIFPDIPAMDSSCGFSNLLYSSVPIGIVIPLMVEASHLNSPLYYICTLYSRLTEEQAIWLCLCSRTALAKVILLYL